MGDEIRELPTDDRMTNKTDLEMIDSLFKNKDQVNNLAKQFKDSFIGAVLFVILANPQVDKIIRSFGCHNDMALWGVKFLIFVFLFFIIQKKLC